MCAGSSERKATGRPNSASYSVMHTKTPGRTTFLRSSLPAKRSGFALVSAFVSWRARSARKLKKMHGSPSAMRGVPAITVGATNSSVSPRA